MSCPIVNVVTFFINDHFQKNTRIHRFAPNLPDNNTVTVIALKTDNKRALNEIKQFFASIYNSFA